MSSIIGYLSAFIKAATPYWAELIGAFFIAILGNLVTTKGSQKDSFKYFSMAFITIIVRDFFEIAYQMAAELGYQFIWWVQMEPLVNLILTSLITAFFFVGAFKNMKLYFSSVILVTTLTGLFAGISMMLQQDPRYKTLGAYLLSIYPAMGLLMAGISFYMSKATRQNTAVRALGTGFIVLTICYGYQWSDLIGNIQQVTLLGYTITIVLALASQAQLLNIEVSILENKLEAEERSKREIWEISPFPIIISRLRDGMILYMNPMAQQMLTVSKSEVTDFKLFDYFTDAKRKEALMTQLQQWAVVKSFEVQVHHPLKNNLFWIDMTTRTTDWDEEIVLFTTFKDITDQKRATQVLRQQAETDPLTALYNRRQFEILGYQALQSALRYRTPYSVLMFDIDFFKKVNDTHGHDAGDLVLKQVARIMKETLRKSDIVARYGGEEFVAFLPNTAPNDALIAAEHVRQGVEKLDIVYNGRQISVTISSGISASRATNLDVLVRQADQALYTSKKNGRNQVSLFQDVHPEETEENKNESEKDNRENKDNREQEKQLPPLENKG